MKSKLIFLILALPFLLTGCENDLESGEGYPFLEMGDATVTYKVNAVLQNDTDVKPYLNFFDGVELTLSYKNSKPEKLTLKETGAPFSVTHLSYTGTLEFEWEIDNTVSPYPIRKKDTGEVFCYISRDRVVTFPFSLGCASNRYEYQLTAVTE